MDSVLTRLWRSTRQNAPKKIPPSIRRAGRSLVRSAYRSTLRLSSRHRALLDAERALDRDDWNGAIQRLKQWSNSHPSRGMEGSSLEAQLLSALRESRDEPAREFDDAAVAELRPVPNPGMISITEEKLYYHVARESFDPALAVVEIGPWLGRGTQRICDGLSERSDDWRLVCFDRFVWNHHFSRISAEQGAEAATRHLRKGASFEGAFRALMGPYAERIRSVRGTLANIDRRLAPVLPAGRAIGTLFVDASKDWINNVRLLRFFSDRLTTGTKGAMILFQDFLYFPAYRLIFLTMLLPGITPVLYSRTGCTVVFRATSGISSRERAFRADLPETLSQPVIEAAWQRLSRVIPRARIERNSVQLALPLMLWSCGHYDAAVSAFREVRLTESERDRLIEKSGGVEKTKLAPLRALLRGGGSAQ
jgi:hypothetical protein